ncbi:MAG: aminoglycoside phosphotransferase family protein [Actinomycetota bacterium]|nr:aminoglycoside phosphotransferase family protein [Actinomycetota bacterium]
MTILHPDQFEVGVTDVRRLLRAQFPEFADLPISPVVSSGTVNAVFRLGDDMLARLPFVLWGSADIEHEARWLPTIGTSLPVPIPRFVGLGVPDDDYPCAWSILSWMPGAPVEVETTLPGLTADLAGFVVAMRSIDVAGAPACYRGGPLAPLDLDVRRCLVESAQLVDVARLTAIWEDCLDAPSWTGDPVWAHGDLLPGNVLVDDGRLVAVIDFACAGIGDPACDLLAAWSIVPDAELDAFRDAVGMDDATWRRGRGWSLSQAIIALPYYLDTNPVMASNSLRILERLCAVG